MRSWVKRAALAIALILAVLAAVIVLRALLVESTHAPGEPVEVAEEVDFDRAVQRLSDVVQFRTVTPVDDDDDLSPFYELHGYLEEEFPLFHERAQRELVGGLTPHYTVEGTDPSAPHVVFLAHLDVVPVEDGTEDDWHHPPFAGVVDEAFVWGRGTLDNKQNMMAMLEAAEVWFESGGKPQNTLHFVFGHDEETGGLEGAKVVADAMEERDLDVAAVYDEGLLILDGVVPGVDDPVALVGVTEKGYVTLEISARAEGGHSSMPPDELAVLRLAKAIDSLDQHPMVAAIDGPTREMFDELAPEMSFGHRLIFRNLWLFEPLVLSQMTSSPSTNAAVRTTAAPTILRAGQRENVLPQEAVATVNFRIHPRDDVSSVIDYVEAVVGNDHISVEVAGERQVDPSPVARMEGDGFEALSRAFETVHPEIAMAPNMLIALSDSRHFTGLTDDVYRFTPIQVTADDLDRIHGTNERIAIDEYHSLIRYYQALLHQW